LRISPSHPSWRRLGSSGPPSPYDIRSAAFGHHERRVDEAFLFIKRAFVAKLVGDIRQHATQNLVAAPGLKAPMHRFVSNRYGEAKALA